MMKRLAALLMLLAGSAVNAGEPAPAAPAPAAPAPTAKELTAKELAEQMRQAQRSDGFMARMNVAVIEADGRRLMPFKVAVTGQNIADRQRLLVRGISPQTVRDRQFAAVRHAEGGIRAFSYGGQAADAEIPPQARLFDSGLVIWDMLSPWWHWPTQKLAGAEQVGGRACTLVESLAPKGDPAISRVVSCVLPGSGIALSTQIFDGRRKLARTLTVQSTMRRESGALAAKRLTIAEADRSRTEIEVYSGDENFQTGAETFSRLDALSADIKPR